MNDLMISFAFIGLLIFGTIFFGHLATRIGLPPIVGNIGTGIILGPAFLNIVYDTPIITGFSELGVVLLLFLAGIETDIQSLRENFKSSFIVAVLGISLPFVGGWAVGTFYGFETLQAFYLGTLLVATSVSISVQTLRELNYLRSKEGVTVLGAAVIDDVLGLIILTVVLGMSGTAASSTAGGIVNLAWKIPAFFVAVLLIGKFIVPHLLNIARSINISTALYAVGIAIACATAYLTRNVFGMEPIIGAYLIGLMISLTPHRKLLYEKLEEIASAVFIPVFFGSIGLVATFKGFGPYVGLFVVIMVVAIFGKWFAGTWGGRLTGLSKPSSRIIGASMVCRGEVGLIVAAIGYQQHIISSELYTVMVLIAIATTLVTPIMLKALVPKSEIAQE